MYDLKEGSAQGRMPGAGSAKECQLVKVSLQFKQRSAPDKSDPCRGCAGNGSLLICRALPRCEGVIFVKV